VKLTTYCTVNKIIFPQILLKIYNTKTFGIKV